MILWLYTMTSRSKLQHISRLPMLMILALVAVFIISNHSLSPTPNTGAISLLGPETSESWTADEQGASLPLPATEGNTMLRVLVVNSKPGDRPWTSKQAGLLEDYAREQGRQLEWLSPQNQEDVIEQLLTGEGDIAVGLGISASEAENYGIQLTLPWGVSQQQLISRSDTGRIRRLEDLGTRQIALKRSSPMWEYFQQQAALKPAMSVILIPEAETLENILDKVASAQYDVTILDNLLVEDMLSDYLNLEVAFNASEAEMVSWAVRTDEPGLNASLNSFLNRQYLQAQIARSYKEDLPGLQERKLLRLITYQSPTNYYLHSGKLKGFEHDLVKRFAESHQLRLDVVVAESHLEMQELLLSGKGDLIAASLPRNSYSSKLDLEFSRAYSHAAPVVVGRSKDTPLLDARSLAGRRIVLPASSPYRSLVERIRDSGVELDLVMADSEQSTEAILFRVAGGVYDLTVIGAHEVNAHFSRQINVRAHFVLSEPLPHAWAVRKTDTLLLTSINEFLSREYRKGFYNLLYTKYIEKPRAVLGDTQLLAGVEKLSPYDDIVHKVAQDYDFDWRLIVAQMYQESQFDPNALSYAGAEGLMQIIPETADLLGLADSYDPAASIQAGVRYMDYLRDKFVEEELSEDRIWFSLAAYNAGYNRVQRARKLAKQMNLDSNKWFDNVELAMMAMARPVWKDGELARNCRCGQTVVYVRDIRTLYNNYVRLTRSARTVSTHLPGNRDI